MKLGFSRGTAPGQKMFHFAGYTLDVACSSLRSADREIDLRPKVFAVLRYLVENADRLVTKEELIKEIWPHVIVAEESLTHCISEIRSAIGDSKQTIIKTVPRRGYRLVASVLSSPGDAALGVHKAGSRAGRNSDGRVWREPLLLGRPSIAVLPFVNLSGNPQQECDGLTEDIVTELSRFSELMVIARNSTLQYKNKAIDVRQIGRELGARYVLAGSMRRDGDRIRITAQLIDALTGTHRWAERYDRELSNILAVQVDVACRIVAILAAHVNKAEAERTLLKPAKSWQADDYYLRGAEAYCSHVRDPKGVSISEVRCLLEKSPSIDSGLARSYAMLARTRVRTYWDTVDDDYLDPAGIDRAHELARRAVLLDAGLPLGHFQLGLALLFKRRRDEAVAEFDRAFELNPNYTDYQLGFGLVLAGLPARAIEVLEANIRLDPFGLATRFLYVGQANYMLGRYAQAVPPLRKCASQVSNLALVNVFLAAAQAQLGQLEQARTAVTEALQIYPALTIEKVTRALPYNDPRDVAHLADGARKAGLPES